MAETAAPPRPAAQIDRGTAYDQDFVLWMQNPGGPDPRRRVDLVDRENLAEESESLGVSDRRELCSRLEVLLMHLLKWQSQPVHRSRGLRSTIRSQRGRIERVLKQSPSLRREVAGLSVEEYARALEAASAETGFALDTFPDSLPYSPEQILDETFFPGPLDENP